MHRIATLGAIVVSSSAIAQCDPSTVFLPNAPTYATGSGPRDVALGDFNGDGVLDAAAVEFDGNRVSVLIGNGDGTFQPVLRRGVGIEPTSIALGDIDKDGFLDIVVTIGHPSELGVNVLRGNGDGTFGPVRSYDRGMQPTDVAIAEFDTDGRTDLVVTNPFADTISVLLGDCEGEFLTEQFFAVGDTPSSVDSDDVNGDGFADIVVANFGSDDLSLLIGNGFGSFQSEIRLSVGDQPTSVLIVDLNGDGALDIASANRTDDFFGDVSVLLGNGDGTFQLAQSYEANEGPTGLDAADIDGNGALDLIVSNGPIDVVSVLFGVGDGTFGIPYFFVAGEQPSAIAVGDLDGDGDPDAVLSNEADDDVTVFVNACPAPPSISSQPQPTQLADAGTTVVLSVAVGSGTVPVSYQWRKNGSPLVDDARVSGASTNTLTIMNTNADDTDSYDVVVSNDAGMETSETSLLAIRASECLGDADNNNTVNFSDLVATLSLFGPCPE